MRKWLIKGTSTADPPLSVDLVGGPSTLRLPEKLSSPMVVGSLATELIKHLGVSEREQFDPARGDSFDSNFYKLNNLKSNILV